MLYNEGEVKVVSQEKELIKKLYEVTSLMICDSKTSRAYGTDESLSYSELSFLKCIERNPKAKAGDISQYLGITNGAVAQLASKLEKKACLEAYRLNGNKKEVYYRLLEKGIVACKAYDHHNNRLNAKVEAYLENLDQETIQRIQGLFDTIITEINTEKACYIKCSEHKGKSSANLEGRCEKCKRIY